MKKIFAVLLALTLLFSLAACGAGNQEPDLYEVVLCLDWTPNTNHTGFYVADSLGYYEEEGIKIKIVQPPEDGAEIMTASGQAQFGISFQDTLAAAFALEEPIEVTAVAAVLQHNTSGIISRKGEGMDTPAGLENKRYSTWNSPIELKMVEHLMKKSGADYEKLQLVPSVTNEAEALRNEDVDAIWIYYGLSTAWVSYIRKRIFPKPLVSLNWRLSRAIPMPNTSLAKSIVSVWVFPEIWTGVWNGCVFPQSMATSMPLPCSAMFSGTFIQQPSVVSSVCCKALHE